MTVEKVNALTKRWCAAVAESPGSDSTVLSGAGVWPLLAFLADGADATGRAELATALGVPAEDAARAAREVLAVMESSAASRIALGLWTRREAEIHEAWLARLAAGVHGALTGDAGTDRKRLDAWASEHTDGLVPRMPVTIGPATMLVLASALTVDVTWREHFHAGRVDSDSPWAADGRLSVLRRSGWDLRALRLADTPIGRVSALTVVGDGDVDVLLVLGPGERSAAEVLAVGADLAGPRDVFPAVSGADLAEGAAGPGLSVETVDAMGPGDVLAVTTVPFRVRAEHDLRQHAALFGLEHVMTPGSGHFPGVSAFPLTVDQARQDAVAVFTASGFRAAAVTAFAMRAGAAPRPSRIRRVSAVFDRPFAYYAVHRPSGLILVAGWVGEPDQDVSSGSA
ncbi:serpin family protein [Catenulispora subtropica]|uniref:Serpin domain-containing protein n=1 Tax=Catenulispora subtropica TaxID=450798 RepID=A0ABN2SVN9_9ACTN